MPEEFSPVDAQQSFRAGLSALMAAAIAAAGVFLVAPAAHAEDAPAAPTLAAEVTEIPGDRIVIEATGTGYGAVAATTGAVSLGLVESGTLPVSEDAVIAEIGAGGEITTLSEAFEKPAAELDASVQYEVVSWPSDGEPTAENLYARAAAEIDWNALLPEPGGAEAPGAGAEKTEPAERAQSGLPDPADAAPAAAETPAEAATPPTAETPPAAPAAATPGISVDVEEIPDEKIVIHVTGSGFQDVKVLPGQTEPHVYLALIPKGLDVTMIGQGSSWPNVSAEVEPDGTLGAFSAPFELAADRVERGQEYEVISWPSRSEPSEASLYARADAEIDWDALFSADAPRVTGEVTAASARTGLTVEVGAENIAFPSGQELSGVTVAVIERGRSVVGNEDVVNKVWVPRGAVVEGAFETALTLPKSSLDRYAQYEIVLFENAEFDRRIVSSDLTISEAQWVAVFGKALPAKVTVDAVSVVPTGLNVDVSAKGLPGSKVYVAIIERGTEANLTQDGGYADFLYQPPVKNGAGKFNFVVSKDALNRSKLYEVLIWKSHSNPDSSTIYGRADIRITQAQWDALANTTPEKKPRTSAPEPTGRAGGAAAAGSLTWGISSSFYDYTTNKKRAGGKSGGQVLTSGVGGGPGAYVFPQATGGSWDKQAQTGTVRYSGVVTFTAHKGLMNETFSNPIITVSSATSGTISAGGRSFPLNLAAGSKTVGSNGEVTWSGVPVNGSISGGGGGGGGSLGLDPVSFTVGTPSGASFGATSSGAEKKPAYQAAATPPTTEGLEVLTPADKLVPGGRIEIQARGFDPEDEGVLVVLYSSDPIVLDDTATADESGLVQWSGTLPEDIELGEHVITLQGSTNAGAIIDIVSGDRESAEKALEEQLDDQARAASLGGALGPAGMGLWEWWASALGLVAIAACTTTLAVRQQRGAP